MAIFAILDGFFTTENGIESVKKKLRYICRDNSDPILIANNNLVQDQLSSILISLKLNVESQNFRSRFQQKSADVFNKVHNKLIQYSFSKDYSLIFSKI